MIIMIIECRKGYYAFSRLINQPNKKPQVAFCIYIIATEIDKFHCWNLFAKLCFAVEIQEFRLSIVVIALHNDRAHSDYFRQADANKFAPLHYGVLPFNDLWKYCIKLKDKSQVECKKYASKSKWHKKAKIKRNESTSLFVSEWAQIAPRWFAFCERSA